MSAWVKTRHSRRKSHVRFTPESGHVRYSFDHLVGAAEQHWRHGEAQRFGGFEIDGQLELDRLLNREISRFRASKYPVGGLFAKNWKTAVPAGPTTPSASQRTSGRLGQCGILLALR